jgi:hypothetical protein
LFWNVSKIPKVTGAILNANHVVVPVSASTRGLPIAGNALRHSLCRAVPEGLPKMPNLFIFEIS